MPKSLSEIQQKQLQSVRELFQGRSLVSHGGTLTAEAREPQRQDAVLEQLELAHKLREKLEKAAEKAESAETSAEDVRQLIIDHSDVMNRLASLTEAVKNGYVMHSYEEYNNWSKEESERRDDEMKLAMETLRDQVERMANPEKEWPLRTYIEPQPEKPAQTREMLLNPIANLNLDASDIGNMKRRVPQIGGKEKLNQSIRGHVLAMQEKIQTAKEKTRKKQQRKEVNERSKKKGSQEELKENVGAVAAKLPGDHRSKRKSHPTKLREEVMIIENTPADALNQANDDARPDSVPSAPVPTSTRKPTPRRKLPAPKKCHSCKELKSADVIRCRFVLATGCRCGKSYCLECLKKDYEGQLDLENVEEFFCPACIGICKCKPCQTQREKDERREALIQEMQRSKPKRQRISVARFSFD